MLETCLKSACAMVCSYEAISLSAIFVFPRKSFRFIHFFELLFFTGCVGSSRPWFSRRLRDNRGDSLIRMFA